MTNDDFTRGPDEMDLPDQPGLTDEQMAAEELGGEYPGIDDDADFVEVEMMEASMTAIGTVSTEEFEGSQCLIGNVAIEGDASLSGSAVGMLTAGSVGLHQSGAMVIVVDGDAAIEQGGAQVVFAQSVGLENAGAGVLVAGDASVARSWVGLMAARNATISDDSRVVIDTRSALIIGGFLFGGLGLLAAAMMFAVHKRASRMPHMPNFAHGYKLPANLRHMHMPDMPKVPDMPKMPDMPPALVDLIAKLRHAG